MHKSLILGARMRNKAEKVVELEESIKELNKRSELEAKKLDQAGNDEEVSAVEKNLEDIQKELDEKLAEKIQFAQTAAGALISPFDSWLLMRSLKTLKLRVEAAQTNAEKLIEFFQSHDAVDKIYYPTLNTNKGKKIHESQATGGGSVFSFTLKDDSKVKTFFESLNVALFAASLGGAETLVTHPSTITHAEMPEEEKEARGFTHSLIRVAAGFENIDDLIGDFKQALEK